MSSLPLYPASTLAKLFHLTERRVQKLAKEGIIPKAERSKYDLVGSVRGYVAYLQARAAGRIESATVGDSTDIKSERKRLIKAQADKTEAEHQKLRGELIALTTVEAVLQEVAVLLGSGVDALPGRLAHELAGLHDAAEVKARLYAACCDIRASTAHALRRFVATTNGPVTGGVLNRCERTDDAG